jgi:hypothetical protein
VKLRFFQSTLKPIACTSVHAQPLKILNQRGVAIFAKACFGHPSPSKRQKLNATANAFGAPIRPRHLVPTQQGVGTLAPNDLTPCRMALKELLGDAVTLVIETIEKHINCFFVQALQLDPNAENPGNVALAK